MKNKKIGVGFHLVANDVYESYDKGEEPKEKDLKELYELSKEFVKNYEEREPQTSLLEDLEDLVGQLQSDKITEDQVIEILSNIVKYEKEKKWINVKKIIHTLIGKLLNFFGKKKNEKEFTDSR